MAEKVGDAYVELGTRDQALTAGLSGGLRAVKRFAVAASAIFAGVAAGRGISGLVVAYSDAIETTNKFNEVFNGAAQDINKVADELAASYGLIGTSSRKLLADTGDILVGFGFTEDAALDLAKRTNELAVDLASFTNIEGGSARASQALTKALVGETEQAKALGIVIRQNSKEFKNIVARLQKAEGMTILQAKAMAALEIATNQSRKAQGDYARTQDQLANQMRLTRERMTELKEATGGLIVRFTSADGKVRTLNERLAELSQRLRDVDGATIATAKDVVKIAGGFAAAAFAASKLTPLVTKLAASMVALSASGGILAALGGAAAITAGIIGIGKIAEHFVKMRHAINGAKQEAADFAEQQEELLAKFGTKDTGLISKIRQAIMTQNQDDMETLKEYFPKAFAKASAQFMSGLATADSAASAASSGDSAAKSKGPSFAFASFEDAIRNIQMSLGKDDSEKEQKRQTNILSSIDGGIKKVIDGLGAQPIVGV